MEDAIFDLARTVVQTRYEDLSPESIRITKMFILDSFGVALAGSTATGCKEAIQLIKELGDGRTAPS